MNEKKYYLIYQVTNNVNGKTYIGKHETNNLEDDYMGSGKLLKKAQQKYGLENFTFKVLMYLHNEEEMNLLEHLVVTPEFCQRKDVYNINEGGDGGWSYINLNSDYQIGSDKRRKVCQKAGQISMKKFHKKYGENSTPLNIFLNSLSDDEYQKYVSNVSNQMKRYYANNPGIMSGKNNPRYGKKNSKYTRQCISNAMKTDKNFMKNAHWYVNYQLRQNIILHDGDDIPNGFIPGKCQNFDKYEQFLKQKKEKNIKQQKIKEELKIRKEKEKELKIEKQKIKEQNLNKKKKLLQEMCDWYKKYGWESTVKQFNYQYTQQAFSNQYVKYFGIGISGRKIKKKINKPDLYR